MANEEQIHFTQDIEVSRPAPVRTFPVRRERWETLKNRVRRCHVRYDWWSIVASFLFAVGLFGLSLALSAPSGDEPLPTEVRAVYWAVAAVGIATGVVASIARVAVGNKQKGSIEEVIEYMAEIQEDFPSGQGPEAVENNSVIRFD